MLPMGSIILMRRKMVTVILLACTILAITLGCGVAASTALFMSPAKAKRLPGGSMVVGGIVGIVTIAIFYPPTPYGYNGVIALLYIFLYSAAGLLGWFIFCTIFNPDS